MRAVFVQPTPLAPPQSVLVEHDCPPGVTHAFRPRGFQPDIGPGAKGSATHLPEDTRKPWGGWLLCCWCTHIFVPVRAHFHRTFRAHAHPSTRHGRCHSYPLGHVNDAPTAGHRSSAGGVRANGMWNGRRVAGTEALAYWWNNLLRAQVVNKRESPVCWS